MASVLSSKHSKEKKYQDTLKSNLYTIVSCIVADGRTLFLMFIIREGNTSNPSLHVPTVRPIPQKRINQYPVYISTSKTGYMNQQLWKETMKIFIHEAEKLQGIGHSDQGLLYLDGCPSHPKEDTTSLLEKANIKAVFFPSNTTHIVQPCDDKVFANYKKCATPVFNRTAARCTLSEEDQNTFALYDCLTAYHSGVTKQVIIASFRDRGICPFDRPRILANALEMNPLSNLTSVDKDFQFSRISPVIISIINGVSKTPVDVNRMQTPLPNLPVLVENLENWKDGRTTRSKKVDEIAPASMEIDELRDEEEDGIFESDMDDFEIVPITLFRGRPTCDHCKRQAQGKEAAMACFDCNNYYLCAKCYNITAALEEHVKTHPELNKRRLRIRGSAEPLTLPSSSDI